ALNELSLLETPEVVIAGELGFLGKGAVEEATTTMSDYPLIDTWISHPIGQVETTHTFSLENDLYLDHHRINGVAVVPGVMGLEMFYSTLKNYSSKPFSLVNISFGRPIKLLKDKPIEVRCIWDPLTDTLKLESDFYGPDGLLLDTRTHFTSEVEWVEGEVEKIKVSEREFSSKKRTTLSSDQIYDLFFHGPRFQVLQSVKVGERAAEGSASKPLAKALTSSAKFVSSPFAVEACFQVAGLWDLVINERMSLPSKIGKISWIAEPKKMDNWSISAVLLEEKEQATSYSIILYDSEKAILKIERYEMIHTGQAKLDLKNTSNSIPFAPEMDQLFPGTENVEIKTVDLNHLKSYQMNDQILKQWLSDSELSTYKLFKFPKRQIDWLGGRLAVKEAASKLISFDWTQTSVKNRKSGEPYLEFSEDLNLSYHEVPLISITHRDSYAVGAASSNRKVAIDLEVVENRSSSFLSEAFSEEEITVMKAQGLDDLMINRCWAAKEAAVKLLSTGLKVDLYQLSIQKIGNSKIEIGLSEELADEQGSKIITVQTANEKAYIGTYCEKDNY
ncbi:MAG: 4'-phosphopantetheinyl transferase superfamily protein, partial [Candidatus Kariarchaeaceae archaeon]